ncbi:hypothetical protein [Streptomyces sp. NPDC047061]|uniref:hypothetical protein n=1 Tax=Streptomyces sp. NPDC047061 TaxID=3154605 RepID=UPI0033C0DCB5
MKTLRLVKFASDKGQRRMIGARLNVTEARHRLARKDLLRAALRTAPALPRGRRRFPRHRRTTRPPATAPLRPRQLPQPTSPHPAGGARPAAAARPAQRRDGTDDGENQ